MKKLYIAAIVLCAALTVGYPLWLIHHLRPDLGVTFESIEFVCGIYWVITFVLSALVCWVAKGNQRLIVLLVVFLFGGSLTLIKAKELAPKFVEQAMVYSGPCEVMGLNIAPAGKYVSLSCSSSKWEMRPRTTRQSEVIEAMEKREGSPRFIHCNVYTDGTACGTTLVLPPEETFFRPKDGK